MKRRKFVFVLIVLLFTLSVPCFAEKPESGNLYSVSTDHFKIVYSESTARSAERIYEKCEDIYIQLCILFGTDPQLSIPVYLTDEYIRMNAFFSAYPSNHIVVYDTATDSADLLNLEDGVLSVFRHELTHAFNYNLRNGFWSGVSSVLGDVYTIGPLLYENSLFMEGLAVYSESIAGYGRTNDSSFVQYVRQAKAEGSFPTWQQVNGCLDVYPSGNTAYMYGSAFLQYLSDTYGHEKLIEFFHAASGIHLKFTEGLLKTVFGKSARTLWADFRDSIAVPETFQQPRTLGFSHALYGKLVYGGDCWYGFENSSGSVVRLSADLSSKEKVFPICYQTGDFDFSGEFGFAVTGYGMKNGYLALFDRNGKRIKTVTFPQEEDASVYRKVSFLKSSSFSGFAAWTTRGKNSFITLFGADFDPDGNPCGFTKVRELSLDSYNFRSGDGYSEKAVVDMCSCNAGLVFILSENSEDRFVVYNIEDNSFTVIDNPAGLKLRSVTCNPADGNELYFSYGPANAGDPAFIRCGKLVLEKGEEGKPGNARYFLSGNDILGGINRPVTDGNGNVLYFAKLKNGNLLCSVSGLEFEPGAEESMNPVKAEEEKAEKAELTGISGAGHYSRYGNFMRGVIFPLATDRNSSLAGLGLTYTTEDATEKTGISVSAGYTSDYGKTVFANFVISDSVLPLSPVLSVSVYNRNMESRQFNPELYGSLNLSYPVSLKDSNSSIEFGETLQFVLPGTVAGGFDFSNTVSVVYSDLQSTGLGYYDAKGMKISFVLYNLMPFLSFNLYSDGLLPLDNTPAFTFRIPFSVGVSSSFDPERRIVNAGVSLKTVLFSWEIQDGIPLTHLYIRRFDVDFSIAHSRAFFLKSGTQSRVTELNLDGLFRLMPAIGSLGEVLNLVVSIGPSVRWTVGYRPEFFFVFSVNNIF